MATLEELKRQRRELDAKIKELEKPKYLQCGNARYEHRVYSTGKIKEIIAVNQPKKMRGKLYTEWWGQMISASTKDELITRLRGIIENLQQILEKLEVNNEIR